MCTVLFTDKTFCLPLFTSNNPNTSHLHSEGDTEIWWVKLGAGWPGEWAAAFIFEWNRLLVQGEGNERDLTTLGLAGSTHGQNGNEGESWRSSRRRCVEPVHVCDGGGWMHGVRECPLIPLSLFLCVIKLALRSRRLCGLNLHITEVNDLIRTCWDKCRRIDPDLTQCSFLWEATWKIEINDSSTTSPPSLFVAVTVTLVSEVTCWHRLSPEDLLTLLH